MSKTLFYSISVVILLLATSNTQAEVVISTATGNGADTSLENDGQSGNHGPDSVHGADSSIAIRNYEGVRQKFGYIRFDLTGIAGDFFGATLSITVNISNRNRNWLIYGLVDESLDNWDEATICYNNAPGILPALLGSFALDTTKLQLLGLLSVLENTPTRETPNTYTSNPADLNLDSFLNSDINKLVTFVIINENSDSNASYWVATKEGDPATAPTLTFPNAALDAAMNPNPADEAVDVLHEDLVLSWTPGKTAISHDVYFGDDVNMVSNANRANPMGILLIEGQDPNTFTLDPLNFNHTYYWRIDEVGITPDSICVGQVWSFTTEPFAYPIPGENITATASSSEEDKGPENTVNGSGLDESGLLHGIVGANTMWLSNKDGVQPSWIEYAFDRVYKLHEMWVWNSNEGLEPLIGLGIKEVTIEYSANGTDYITLGPTHEFAQATGTVDYAHNTSIDFGGAVAQYVRLTAISNWGDILNQYGLSEVRFFYIPVSARYPYPESGAINVDVDVILGWRAGREAATHNVYLGRDQQAVIDGTIAAVSVTGASYTPELDLSNTYYWRIDEVNETETPATWQGDVWSFSTSEYLVVEDFESYNDIDPPNPTSNRIFESWSDGFEVATNGALVGNDLPPYMERTIVHGGVQSMPLFYNNTDGAIYSEAFRTFPIGQDWTQHGIATLVLYFHGTEGNTGQLYVSIDGAKVLYPGDTTDIAQAQWRQWNIDLRSLGLNLQNVTMLAIGIDGNGAGGTLYVDDIVLYRLAPEPAGQL
jgi:hypothetical protein